MRGLDELLQRHVLQRPPVALHLNRAQGSPRRQHLAENSQAFSEAYPVLLGHAFPPSAMNALNTAALTDAIDARPLPVLRFNHATRNRGMPRTVLRFVGFASMNASA